MRILITKISAIMPWRAGFAPNDGNKSSGRVVVLLLLIALGLPGCALPGYYAQAARGQFSLLWRSEPIDSVVSDPSVSASRRRQLILASRIRRFAVEQLALPDNASYTRFVDVQHPMCSGMYLRRRFFRQNRLPGVFQSRAASPIAVISAGRRRLDSLSR